jgi:hypothetical protein
MRGDQFIDIEAITDAVEARLCQRMVSQRGSPLGARTHRAAVIRRVEQKEGGAAIANNGRKFLLSRAALQEELDRGSRENLGRRQSRGGPRKTGRNEQLDALQREITGGLRTLREVR